MIPAVLRVRSGRATVPMAGWHARRRPGLAAGALPGQGAAEADAAQPVQAAGWGGGGQAAVTAVPGGKGGAPTRGAGRARRDDASAGGPGRTGAAASARGVT